MSDEQWGPWIEHDGKGQPVPDGTIVQMELKGPTQNGWRFTKPDTVVLHEEPGRAIIISRTSRQGFWNWSNFGRVTPSGGLYSKTVRYRVKKPKGLKMLEELIQNLPALTKEKEQA
jgi:hypothetical protein